MRESLASSYWLGYESIGSGESLSIDDVETSISLLPLMPVFRWNMGNKRWWRFLYALGFFHLVDGILNGVLEMTYGLVATEGLEYRYLPPGEISQADDSEAELVQHSHSGSSVLLGDRTAG
ncbi:hypothetical protein QYF36_008864 [Acer negundo]|nr:hypothetical protein QYF36_008864 [Acer negundo]